MRFIPFALILGVIALAPAARAGDDEASPAAGKKTDFSQCNMAPSFFMASPTIGADGHLVIDQKALESFKGSSTASEDGLTQTVSIPYPSLQKDLTNKMIYTLAMKDGRPESLETKSDFKIKWPKGFKKPADPYVSSVTHFAYVNDHCYVDSVTSKSKSGKELVTYDHEACNGVLAVVKKYGNTKLTECSMALGEIQTALNKASRKFEGTNKAMGLGAADSGMGYIGGIVGYAQPTKKSAGFGFEYLAPFTAAGTCAMVRKQYGMELDPASDIWPGGGLVGNGGAFVGTAPTDGSAPLPDSAPVK